jgi:hypothetical protein
MKCKENLKTANLNFWAGINQAMDQQRSSDHAQIIILEERMKI